MSDELAAQTLETFRGGKWQLMVVTEPGTREMLKKIEGEVKVVPAPYAVGDVLIAGPGDLLICGPINAAGALRLATQVLAGNQRVITDTHTQLLLAAAVYAYSARPERPDTTAPAAATATAG